jgi:heme A synthase
MAAAVRWIAAVITVLVIVQAMLIGQSLFLADPAKQVLHGWIGNASFLAAIVLVVVAAIAARRGELPGLVASLAVLVVLLMAAQIGLGYSGRRGGWPAALHIPNGVIIVALLASLLTASAVPMGAGKRAIA